MSRDPVRPLLISTGNALAATGQNWRWVRDFCRTHGIVILRAGAKPFVRADELLAALDAAQVKAPELTEAEELDRLRAELLERRRRAAP